MEAWTEWFLKRLDEERLTMDALHARTGISTSMISKYRTGKAFPERTTTIAKLEAVFGDIGPLPGIDRSAVTSFGDRLAALERGLSELRERVAASETLAADAVRLATEAQAALTEADEAVRTAAALLHPAEPERGDEQPRAAPRRRRAAGSR